MIKALLCCSLLVGGAQAMTVGPTFHDEPFGNKIIDLSFLDSESEQATENGPCYELWKCRTICGQALLNEIKEKNSKLLVVLKELEKKELQDKAKNSEE